MSLSDASIAEELENVEPNELVRRALGGCANSFAELSRRFRPRLLRILQPRLDGHWADAEDVAQEALAKAFQQLGRFDPRYQFSTWLYTIALRLAYDHSRSHRRHRGHLRLDALQHVVCSGRPDEAAIQREELGNLWATARRCLAKNQFTALWMRFGEDLSVSEIARVMRKTQVGVRVLLHRARMNLIKQLDHGQSVASSDEFAQPGEQI